ncbi:MAG TPA: NAD(P)H-binding protein [Fibrobacteria bacterium]|nr:NAD(P)H-binding protein [Fibrobacteria bacterium]HOX50478.1 NAD(P)H-binding protein [Fibrobacteria bacterium]
MKILVTTPTGKVGSEVVRALAARNVSRRLALRDPSRAPAGEEAVAFDYLKPETWGPALEGIDRVYLASVGDQPAGPEKAFVDLAVSKGVGRIVKLGAAGIENTDVPLRQVERHIESAGVEWTFVHPTWFWQNFSTAMAGSIKAGVLVEPVGDRWTAFVDARDIAAVAVEALATDSWTGQILTITGPDRTTRAQFVAEVSRQLGREVRFQDVTDARFREAFEAYLTPSYLETLSALYGWVRAGATEFSTDIVEKVIGRKPIGLERFVSDHLEVWR